MIDYLRPGRTVSLMELLEVNAEPYWRCASLLGQLICKLRIVLDGRATVLPELFGDMARVLGEINREVEKLGLRSAMQQTNRINEYVKASKSLSYDMFYQMLIELQTRVSDELDSRPFLVMDSAYESYYKSSQLFGGDVERRFPKMSEDIVEAGKCIALNRSTATVFHLMRVMELGVQEFGTKLGVVLAQEKNWQNILDEVNKAIKAMDHRQPQTKTYAEAASHLYNVKVAWRNEVMHPKQTYTLEEAVSIFTNAKTFIADLVGIV